MTAALETWCSAWKPQDTRTVSEWGEEHIIVPGAARSRRFDCSATPHLREIFDSYADARVRELVAIMPTGAGKTTVFDVCIPHAVAEDPASIALYLQGNKEAAGHMEDRLLPTLRNCAPVAQLMASLSRHAIRKDAVIFPHISLHVGGLNRTNVQRISVRSVFIDEAWMAEHGLIEMARSRTHSRWNRRVVIVSQGGNQSVQLAKETRDSELFAAWRRTDRREFAMVCPQCAEIHIWKFQNLKWANADKANGEIDEAAVMQSVRYECPGCGTRFEGTPSVHRALADGSVYVPTNPAPFIDDRGGMYLGWHCNALAMRHEAWGDLAIGWLKANASKQAGDLGPLKIFIMQRLAEFWKESEEAPEMLIGASGYTFGDYARGEAIDDEAMVVGGRARFASIDKQQAGYWMSVRAFRKDGSSRLLYFGPVTTIEECREIQQRFGVVDAFTAEDASHRPDDVYLDCLKYGWTPMFGDDRPSFPHTGRDGRTVNKPFSVIYKAQASNGKIVRYLRWSNESVKDILFRRVAGKGARFEVPDDIVDLPLPKGQAYFDQITSEVKRSTVSRIGKKVVMRWMKTRRHNHAIDVECMALVFALVKGVAGMVDALPVAGEDTAADESEPSAAV